MCMKEKDHFLHSTLHIEEECECLPSRKNAKNHQKKIGGKVNEVACWDNARKKNSPSILKINQTNSSIAHTRFI